jgi:flavin-dependent trigonelline monooxygenase, reductase component
MSFASRRICFKVTGMHKDAEDQAGPIDPVTLRRAFGTFVTGVTVITTRDTDGRARGMTAN